MYQYISFNTGVSKYLTLHLREQQKYSSTSPLLLNTGMPDFIPLLSFQYCIMIFQSWANCFCLWTPWWNIFGRAPRQPEGFAILESCLWWKGTCRPLEADTGGTSNYLFRCVLWFSRGVYYSLLGCLMFLLGCIPQGVYYTHIQYIFVSSCRRNNSDMLPSSHQELSWRLWPWTLTLSACSLSLSAREFLAHNTRYPF